MNMKTVINVWKGRGKIQTVKNKIDITFSFSTLHIYGEDKHVQNTYEQNGFQLQRLLTPAFFFTTVNMCKRKNYQTSIKKTPESLLTGKVARSLHYKGRVGAWT